MFVEYYINEVKNEWMESPDTWTPERLVTEISTYVFQKTTCVTQKISYFCHTYVQIWVFQCTYTCWVLATSGNLVRDFSPSSFRCVASVCQNNWWCWFGKIGLDGDISLFATIVSSPPIMHDFFCWDFEQSSLLFPRPDIFSRLAALLLNTGAADCWAQQKKPSPAARLLLTFTKTVHMVTGTTRLKRGAKFTLALAWPFGFCRGKQGDVSALRWSLCFDRFGSFVYV